MPPRARNALNIWGSQGPPIEAGEPCGTTCIVLAAPDGNENTALNIDEQDFQPLGVAPVRRTDFCDEIKRQVPGTKQGGKSRQRP